MQRDQDTSGKYWKLSVVDVLYSQHADYYLMQRFGPWICASLLNALSSLNLSKYSTIMIFKQNFRPRAQISAVSFDCSRSFCSHLFTFWTVKRSGGKIRGKTRIPFATFLFFHFWIQNKLDKKLDLERRYIWHYFQMDHQHMWWKSVGTSSFYGCSLQPLIRGGAF